MRVVISWSRVGRLIVICCCLSVDRGNAANLMVDDFSTGALSASVDAATVGRSTFQTRLNPSNTISGRYTILEYYSGPGSISTSVTTSNGGSLSYAADASTVAGKLDLGYGSYTYDPPMNLNITSGDLIALAIDAQFVSNDIPLLVAYRSVTASGYASGGVASATYFLPASDRPYTAFFPFTPLVIQAFQGEIPLGWRTDDFFRDLDSIVISFGPTIPPGASFRIESIYFTSVPEPQTTVLLLVAVSIHFCTLNRRERAEARTGASRAENDEEDKMTTRTLTDARRPCAWLRKTWRVRGLIAIFSFLTLDCGNAAIVVDDFSMGAYNESVDEINVFRTIDQALLNTVDGRRYSVLDSYPAPAGPGSVFTSVTTSNGGSLSYAADANVSAKLELVYGNSQRYSAFASDPLNLNVMSAGGLAIEAEFVSADIQLEVHYRTDGNFAGSYGFSVLRASNQPYTAIVPFYALRSEPGDGAHSGDLDEIHIIFGRDGILRIPPGSSFRINSIYFTEVPEPGATTFLLLSLVGWGFRFRRRVRSGFGVH